MAHVRRRLTRPQALSAHIAEQSRRLDEQRALIRRQRQAARVSPDEWIQPASAPPAPSPAEHRFEWHPDKPRQSCATCAIEVDVVLVEQRPMRVYLRAGVLLDAMPECGVRARSILSEEVTAPAPAPGLGRPARVRVRSRRPSPRTYEIPTFDSPPTPLATRPSRPARTRRAVTAKPAEDEADPSAEVLLAIEREFAPLVGKTYKDIAGPEELELIRVCQAGIKADKHLTSITDPAARAALSRQSSAGARAGGVLLMAHDPLIKMYANRCAHKVPGFNMAEFDDIYQEARQGFLRGIAGYSTGHKAKLSTYAGYWMLQRMGRLLDRGRSLVPLPFNVLEKLKRAQRAGKAITVETMTDPAIEQQHRLDPAIARDAVPIWLGRDISMSATVGDGDGDEGEGASLQMMGSLASEEDVEATAARHQTQARCAEIVAQALTGLDERERDVIQRRMLGKQESLQEIAKTYGITREMVRQVEVAAKAKIRQAILDMADEDEATAEIIEEFGILDATGLDEVPG